MANLDANDLIDLSLLLLTRDAAVDQRTAIPAVQRWGAPAFQPTADLVASRLHELLQSRFLILRAQSGRQMLHPTAEGEGYAAALLARQETEPCAPVHLACALRLALADALPDPVARGAG